jgi:hypothetical protein
MHAWSCSICSFQNVDPAKSSTSVREDSMLRCSNGIETFSRAICCARRKRDITSPLEASVVYMLFCRYQHLSENVRKAKVMISPKNLLSINTN